MYVSIYEKGTTLKENDNILFSKENFICTLNKENEEFDIYMDSVGWCCVIGSGSKNNLAKKAFLHYKKSGKIQSEDHRYFLVLIFDSLQKEILINRDAIGKYHSYYASSSKGFIVSTSIDPIISFLGKKSLKINNKALALYLRFQYIPSPFTLFKQILQVPLSSTVRYSEKKVVIKKEPLHFTDASKKIITDDNYLKKLLKESYIKQNVGKFKKIGAFLSGGMDTSSNISILVTELKLKPIVFTAILENAAYSEVEYAKIVAKKFELEHHILDVFSSDVKYLDEMVGQFDNPVADRAALAQFVLSKKASELGIDCMISGEGGDEILGYPRNLPEYFVPSDQISDDELANLYLGYSQLSSNDLVNKLINLDDKFISNKFLAKKYREFKTRFSFEKIYYAHWQTWLIENVLMKDNQIFKYFDLGYIAPFINIDLMQHMVVQSPYAKPSLLKNKNYLKTSLRDILPSEVITKTKQKFEIPVSYWLRTTLSAYLYENLFFKESFISKYLNEEVIKDMYYAHIKGETDYNRQLWALLILNKWYKEKLK